MGTVAYKPLKIEARDNLSIQFYTEYTTSSDQAGIFNSVGEGGRNSSKLIVDEKGMISMPRLGRFVVAGLTCRELEDTLTNRLKIYVKNPGVFVRIEGFKVNVLGEVRSPGPKSFSDEKVTILDLISTSGGFMDEAKRDSLLIIREDSGSRKAYFVNAQDAKLLYNSPVFQLKQNDMVYVGANDLKFRTLSNQIAQQKVQPITLYGSVLSIIVNFVILGIAVFKL